jgi:hypothetical protein
MELKKCPYCGKNVLAISKVCKHCGKSFTSQIEKPAAAAMPDKQSLVERQETEVQQNPPEPEKTGKVKKQIMFWLMWVSYFTFFPLFFLFMPAAVKDDEMRKDFIYIHFGYPFLLIIGSFFMNINGIWLTILIVPFLFFVYLNIISIIVCYKWTKSEYSIVHAIVITLIPSLFLLGALTFSGQGLYELEWKTDETFSWGVLILTVVTGVSLIAPYMFSHNETRIRFITIYLIAIALLIYLISGQNIPNPFKDGPFFQTLILFIIMMGNMFVIGYHTVKCYRSVKENENIFIAILSIAFPAVVIGIATIIIGFWLIVMVLTPMIVIWVYTVLSGESSSGSKGGASIKYSDGSSENATYEGSGPTGEKFYKGTKSGNTFTT